MADTEREKDGLVASPELSTPAPEDPTGPTQPVAAEGGETAAEREARLGRARSRAEYSESRLSVQGMKFIISGGISAIPDLGLTFILQTFFGVGPVLARTVGFIVGTLTAYFINRRWTFNAEPSTRRLLAVALLYALTWGVNVGLHRLGYNLFSEWGMADGWAIVCAYVIAQGVATVVNFMVQRTLIFRFI